MKNESLKRWYGWGVTEKTFDLIHREKFISYLKKKLSITKITESSPPDINSVILPSSKLPQELVKALAEIVGEANFKVDHETRVVHSGGKSYRDLLRFRSLRIEKAPDAVLFPETEDQIVQILKFSEENKVAVVPFGGGTSVVGGLDNEKAGQEYLIVVDLARMNRLISIDKVSSTANVQCGILGPDLEEQLNKEGFTFGHFPQSFEYSTLGGWIATRSSGQNSVYYGGIDKLVVSLRVATPVGVIETLHAPSHACGPDTKQILIGSEGVCGIILAATVKIHGLPKQKIYLAYLFGNYADGISASRIAIQSGLSPAMIRISDEAETEASFALSSHGSKSFVSRALSSGLEKYLALRGFSKNRTKSLVLVGFEGDREKNVFQKNKIESIFSRFKCLALGAAPGKKWLKERFFLPYLRDELLDNHILTDTFETCTSWSNLHNLHKKVTEGLHSYARSESFPFVIYSHVSHLYDDGASLYFTILAPQDQRNPLGQWLKIKTQANDLVTKSGGVISHHHGIGIDHKTHAPWGPVEKALVHQIKTQLDPKGIMNPGKLV